MSDHILNELLDSALTQQVVQEMGLESVSRVEREKILAALSRNIMNRVFLEMIKAIPPSEHAKMQAYMDAGDMVALRDLAGAHIPDLDSFIQHCAMTEYEATRSAL